MTHRKSGGTWGMFSYKSAIGASLLFFSLIPNTWAGAATLAPTFVDDFMRSFQETMLPLSFERFQETASQIFVAGPSRLEEWGVINQDAGATYNGLINTIVLKPESLGRDPRGRLRIATIPELQKSYGVAFGVYAAQIFHEMAHAEWDVIVEEGKTHEDRRLYQMMHKEIVPWLRRNHPGNLAFTYRILVQEIFGYYRGDLVGQILSDARELLLLNGIDPMDGHCIQWSRLKELAHGLSFEEFNQFLPLGAHKLEDSYRDHFAISEVYVQGKDFSLNGENERDPFRPEWFAELWDHVDRFYSLPRNKMELVDRLNRMPFWREKLEHCRNELVSL